MGLFGKSYAEREAERQEKERQRRAEIAADQRKWEKYQERKVEEKMQDDLEFRRNMQEKIESGDTNPLAQEFKANIDFVEVAFDDDHKVLKAYPAAYATPVYIPYGDIKDFEIIEDSGTVSRGDINSAMLGGFLFGGAGMIAGSVLGDQKSTKVVEKLILRIKTTNSKNPFVDVTYVSYPVERANKEYKLITERLSKTVAHLEEIAGNDTPATTDPYEEIKKLKELLDLGIVTEEEFTAKKRQLLGI